MRETTMTTIIGPELLGRTVDHDPRNKDHPFPVRSVAKPVSKTWGIQAPILDQGKIGSCHDPDTEVLTRHGWLPFPHLTMDNELATVDPVTAEITYEKPVGITAKPYGGNMHYLKTTSHDFAVTADHTMLVRKWDEAARTLAADYTRVTMDRIGWYSGLMTQVVKTGGEDVYTIPGIPGYKRASQRDDLVLPMADWLRFLGIYMAEGSMVGRGKNPNQIQLAASKEREKSFIRDLLPKVGLSVYEMEDRFIFSSARLYRHMEELGLKGVRAPEKFVPRFVFEQSGANIECFLQGHREGDGSFQNGTWTHHTSSWTLADDLQELAFLAGYKTGVSVRQPRTSMMADGRKVTGNHPEYAVRALKGSQSSIQRRSVRVEHYEGMVYCAEVPTHHTLVTRRNGKILISGNCEGNTAIEWLNTDIAVKNRKRSTFKSHDAQGFLNEIDAVQVYSKATHLDEDKAEAYPPTDCGTSALGIAKAMKFFKAIDSYTWSFGWDHFTAAIDHGPVMLGTNWYAGMFHPTKDGFVEISGDVQGGHAYLARGIDYENQRVLCRNHWGTDWGLEGEFYLSFATLQRLLKEQGDVLVPTLLA